MSTLQNQSFIRRHRRIFSDRFSKQKADVHGIPTSSLFLPALIYVTIGAFLPILIIGVFSLTRFDYGLLSYDWNFDHYRRFFSDPTYSGSLIASFGFVGFVSLLTMVVTLPFSYFVATKVSPVNQIYWLSAATIPFFTSYLVRVIAFLNLLGESGVINYSLQQIGLIDQPLQMLGFGRNAIIFTFVYLQSPILVLMSFVAIRKIDGNLRQAAADLGARPVATFLRVSLPLMIVGLINGFLYAFMSMVGDYITPVLVGGSSGYMYVNILMNQFGPSLQWDFGAALAIILLLGILVLVVTTSFIVRETQSTGQSSATEEKQSQGLKLYAIAFLLFQYAPIALLFLFALNSSEIVGFPIRGISLRWFIEIFDNQALLAAFGVSLKVAFVSVVIGVCLGGLAGISIARSSRQRRSILMPLISAPLLLPPVILGIGIIMAMAAIDAPFGWWRIAFAHSLLTIPIIAMIVVAQLQGMGTETEIAAMDLGAKPLRAFVEVTLPQLVPALATGAFLAFAISMDEFIMTFLVTGYDITLPIYIYTSIRFKMSPAIVAASALQILLSFAFIIIGMRIFRARSLSRSMKSPI